MKDELAGGRHARDVRRLTARQFRRWQTCLQSRRGDDDVLPRSVFTSPTTGGFFRHGCISLPPVDVRRRVQEEQIPRRAEPLRRRRGCWVR